MVWERAWNPMLELERMRNRIDNLMNEVTSMDFESVKTGLTTKIPETDIWKGNGKLIVEMNMPGISKENINLKATDKTISVSSQIKKAVEEKKEGVYRSERSWNSFKRTTMLPKTIDPNKIKAKYKDGVLRIEAPITDKQELEKKIKVGVN